MTALLLCAAALAGEPLSLEGVREALGARSIAVETARAQEDAARAEAGVAFGATLPAVVGFADASAGAGMTATGLSRPVYTQLVAGATASWTLVDPSAWAAATAARRSAQGRSAMVAWAAVLARAEATRSFASALAAEEEAAALKAAYSDAKTGAEAVADLVAAGLRPPADQARAEAAAAALAARAAAAEAEVVSRCAALQAALRRPADGDCALDPVSWAEPEAAAGEHPAVTASRAALDAAKSSRSSAAWALAPTLSAQGTAAEYWIAGAEPGPGWSAGLGLDVPLLAGGAGQRALSAEAARAREAALALEAQERDLEAAQVAAEARYRASKASLEALEASLRAAEVALTLVDERYRAGLEGVTDWLAARQARDEAAVALARGRAALAAALAEVEAARGVR